MVFGDDKVGCVDRSSCVVEVDTAEYGMIIASTTAAPDLKVSTDVELKPAQVKLSSFAGSLAIKFQPGDAVVQPMMAPFTAAFRTLVIGQRGIWWWKRIEILGAAAMSDSDLLDLIEDGLTDEDYAATY